MVVPPTTPKLDEERPSTPCEDADIPLRPNPLDDEPETPKAYVETPATPLLKRFLLVLLSSPRTPARALLTDVALIFVVPTTPKLVDEVPSTPCVDCDVPETPNPEVEVPVIPGPLEEFVPITQAATVLHVVSPAETATGTIEAAVAIDKTPNCRPLGKNMFAPIKDRSGSKVA